MARSQTAAEKPAAHGSRGASEPARSAAARWAMLVYAATGYVVGLGAMVYIIGFLADVGVPKSVNDGPEGPVWFAVAVNLGLIGLFGLHHSATARAAFKRRWAKVIPPPIERATYLHMSAAATALLVLLWRPIPVTLWRVETPEIAAAMWALYLAAWGMMIAATFHFGHFRFMGLAQAWEAFRRKPPATGAFSARFLYAAVRHPISLGWMIAPFLTPHMTVGLLVFALGVIGYIVIATPFEEADLIEEIGEDYRRYREGTPPFLPALRPGRRGAKRDD